MHATNRNRRKPKIKDLQNEIELLRVEVDFLKTELTMMRSGAINPYPVPYYPYYPYGHREYDLREGQIYCDARDTTSNLLNTDL